MNAFTRTTRLWSAICSAGIVAACACRSATTSETGATDSTEQATTTHTTVAAEASTVAAAEASTVAVEASSGIVGETTPTAGTFGDSMASGDTEPEAMVGACSYSAWTEQFDHWLELDDDGDEPPIPSSCIEGGLTGAFSAAVDGTPRFDADPSITAQFASGQLLAINRLGCRPLLPGKLSTTIDPEFCQQKFQCGCCIVEVQYNNFSPSLKWGIDVTNSCEESFLGNLYVVPDGECLGDTHCPEGYRCVDAACAVDDGTCRDKNDCPYGHDCIGSECIQEPCDACLDDCRGLSVVAGSCCCGRGCLCETECNNCGFGF